MAALAVLVASESDQGVVLATDLLLQSSDVKVCGLVGCSVSPWFGLEHVRRENETNPDGDLLSASDALNDALSQLEFPEIGCPARLYVGANEVYTMHMIRDEALGQWPRAEGITPPCEHNVFDDSYLQAIDRNIGRLAIG